MKFSELTVLLPCHSLEDFPVYYEGTQADELLAAWCALWHPALVAAAGMLPTWHRIDVPPETLSGRLVAVPPCCVGRLPAGWIARAQSEGAWIVQASSRDAAVAAALAGIDGGAAGIDDRLAADFVALGFCRLQVELLTRQMRYSMHIDDPQFQNDVVAAAQAAIAGDSQTASQRLQQCFDMLYESRKHFYPVDVHLIDLTLLAATTLGPPLAGELAAATPTNLLAPVAVLRQASQDAATWSKLLSAVDAGTVCVLGDEVEESELPLMPLETALANLREGVLEYESLLGRRPRVYARRRAGLSPALPQLLTKLEFQGAVHFTLDDGRFPLGPQSKTRWEGLDTSVIDVLSQVPCDAAKSDTFLSLSRKLADSMDSDHVATLSLAHWPGATSPWYDDLRRIARLSPVLGKFMLLDDYFSHTDMPGRLSKFAPDDYRTPYLKQAIIRRQADPISKIVRAHRSQAARAAAQAVATLGDLAAGRVCDETTGLLSGDEAALDFSPVLERFSAVLLRGDSPSRLRCLLVNPLSFTRRIGVDWAGLEQAPQADRHFALVDVPAMGFAWVEHTGSPAPSRGKPIARDNVLGNEFFEATINRTTGGIQSLYSFRARGNRLSQQIAMRLSGPAQAAGGAERASDVDARYTTMRAESVDVTVACPELGEIVSRGSLVDGERRVAAFRQTARLWAGSRTLELEIELDELDEPRADPWNSYYATRFAWPDEGADLYRGVGLARIKTGAARLEAPEYIDIDDGSGTISILTGGLPYHRRSQPRMLDSLLVVRGETARRFSLAIGVDLPQPAAAAQELITPTLARLESSPPTASSSGWFFHLGAKNVVATDWRLLIDAVASDPACSAPAIRGFRARLLETAGQAGRVSLRAFRGVASARQVDYLGQALVELTVEGDKIALDFAPHEWIEIEAVWS